MSLPANDLQELIHDIKWHLKDHYDEDFLVPGKKTDEKKLDEKKSEAIRTAASHPIHIQTAPAPKPFVPPPQTPTPTPPPTKTVASAPKLPPVPKTFDVEPIKYDSNSSFSEVKQFYQMHAPNISLKSAPEEIKKGVEVKKGVILLLSFSSHHLSFLKNVAKAIENKFNLSCTVELVDEKYIWRERGFKRVIASGYGVDGYFKSHLKEEGCLGHTPLIELPDLTQYFNEPHLKRTLWLELCQELRKLSSI